MKPESDDDEEEEDDDGDAEQKEDEDEEDTVQANIDENDKFKLPGAGKEGEFNLVHQRTRDTHCLKIVLDLEVYSNPPSIYVGLLQMDLQTIHQRIKDNVDVLSHFTEKREEGKERSEYLSLLRSDLCTYYSYNEFLISKLMDLFPLSEVCVWIC